MSHVSAARSWVLDTFPELKEYEDRVSSLPDLRLFESEPARASLSSWDPWNALMEDLNTMVHQDSYGDFTDPSGLELYQALVRTNYSGCEDLTINRKKKATHRWWCATFPIISSFLAINHPQSFVLAIAIHGDHPNLNTIVSERKNAIKKKKKSFKVIPMLIDAADTLEKLDLLYGELNPNLHTLTKKTSIDLNYSPVLVQWLWQRQPSDRTKLKPYVVSNDLPDCYDTTNLTHEDFQALIKNFAHRILEKTIPLFQQQGLDRSNKYPNNPYHFLYKRWIETLRSIPQIHNSDDVSLEKRRRIKEIVRKQETTLHLLFDSYDIFFQQPLNDDRYFPTIIQLVLLANQTELLRKISSMTELGKDRCWPNYSLVDNDDCWITATHYALYVGSIDCFNYLLPISNVDNNSLLITAAQLRKEVAPYKIVAAIEYLLKNHQYDRQTLLKARQIAADNGKVANVLLKSLGGEEK